MKFNASIKTTIAAIITVVVLTTMYFGAYLPLRKSQLWINALSVLNGGKIQSVQDFNDNFDSALSFYSPVGQDEMTSYYFGIIVNMVNQQDNKQIIEILANEAEKWMDPILKAQKGFGFSQNLYNFAMFYEIAAQKLQSDVYLQKSFDLFNEGLKYSPNRFIFLSGLFNVYQLRGETEKAKEIGEIIIKYWPENEQVKKLIEDMNK